ncbi:esterase/lipase family protein [candidate division CSSED10-310 bacterium]|uniref:Esterase/lipase family protein n=1 Tax=candidate division CSSED10-310 bacterium TaxID=2855610 RepID=A0ABV6Z486_UNCC1
MDEAIKKPNVLLTLLEVRALAEFGLFCLVWPALTKAPSGDGHTVLIIPGFGVGDTATVPLRYYLRGLGYDAQGWGLGLNLGTNARVRQKLVQRLEALRQSSGRKVSLIGWSLGGVFARELARKFPHHVRLVITLGAPFTGNPQANNLLSLSQLFTGKKFTQQDRDAFEKRQAPPPVPTTAIHSRSDGIIAWQCSLEQESLQTENIEVSSSHFGLVHNPQVAHIIADRLAQKEDDWQPFKRNT